MTVDSIISCALAAMLAACSAGVHPVDRDLAALRAGLVGGDFEVAWAGLSAEQREVLDAQAFRNALENDPQIAEDLVALIDQALEDPGVSLSARITLEDGRVVVMSLVEGRWVLESPATTFYGQATPREALVSFLDAFEAERWDVMADLVPSKYSVQDDAAVLEKAWSDPGGREVIERLIKIIDEHLYDEIEVQGNRAFLRHPEGQVTFLREGGLWVILDFD
ncbi:MAG: hypothetical protein JRG91_00060 [Deltaproteobacteria bacterium]|nr:hypothetical protein [Deltaproteobacteria bacterium]